MRQGKVFYKDFFAGIITEENELRYVFQYDPLYVKNHPGKFITFTMPVTEKPYHANRLFPFFEGLLPEGWLLDKASEHWKIKKDDKMGLLLTCCRNCIGAVSVEPMIEAE